MKRIYFFYFFCGFALAVFSPQLRSQVNLIDKPEGICYYEPQRAWYVTNVELGQVIRIDSLGNQSVFWDGINLAMGIEAIGDSLYISSNEPYRVSCLSIHDSALIYYLPTTGVYAVSHMDYDSRFGLLYIVNQYGGLMRVNVLNRSYQIFVPTGTGLANGSQTVIVDTIVNRLYVFSWPLAYVRSVSMTDSTDIINLFSPGITEFISSATDDEGNIYVSSWATNRVYKYPPHLIGSSEVFSVDHAKPSGLAYNPNDGVLAVCNYGDNTIDFIQLITGIDATYNDPGLFQFNIFPVPVVHHATITFDLKDSAPVHLTITNLARQNLYSLNLGTMPMGQHVVTLHESDIPEGISMVTLFLNNHPVDTKQLVKIPE
ncbi:MAG: hypothetical protein JXA23_02570 [Bacteroidales bacterium]|nr:hypothetical protein [Bacteroidales bacterium]